MIRKNEGYSLTVLVIAIVVIIIITTTAVISIKDFGKDKDISNFMNDLELVKQHVIEYYAQNGTLPVIYNPNGSMKSAEGELIELFSGEKVLSQFHEEDTGDYYYVDIEKLGKIHLSNEDRGYIINEESLNVYVTSPVNYNGVDYYTLTPFLLGKETTTYNKVNFEMNVMGNPLTWAKEAELLVSIPNVKVGEAEGWNFKWGKTSEISSGDETGMNYFTYGDTITIKENGIYTIIAENPEGISLQRKVVVSKVDNMPPVIMYVDGELYVDDAETGVKTIRCKVKETSRFDIDEVTRKENTKYFTMDKEEYSDTPEDLVESYLWGDKDIKGDTIEDYLDSYKEYYEEFVKINSIIISPTATSGEKDNANVAMQALNNSYPQFAYKNKRYPDSERNIVIYVEDMAGNGTVYSALSRLELTNCQYVSGDSMTLIDSKVTINDDDRFTNDRNVVAFLQSLYAKYVFVTEEQVPTAIWEEFNNEYKTITLSEGDGQKIVYAFFKDQAGKIASAYDTIILDETPPTNDAPTVSYDKDNGLLIIVNQTDTKVVDNIETQSGLTGIYQYGIKRENDKNFIWYSRVSSLPKMSSGTYKIVTKVEDKAGNPATSEEATIVIESEYSDITSLKVGDYVNYSNYIDSTSYTTNIDNTGHTVTQKLTTGTADWRVLSVDEATETVLITTNGTVNSGVYLGNVKGYLGGARELNVICNKLYSSTTLGVTAKNMTIEQLNRACSYTGQQPNSQRYLYYPYSAGEQNGSLSYNGGTYTKVRHKNGSYPSGKFYSDDGGGADKTDENGFSYRETEKRNPVYVSNTLFEYDPSEYNSIVASILGKDTGWLSSQSIYNENTNNEYDAYYGIQYASSSIVGGYKMCNSCGETFASTAHGLHPVVSLNINNVQVNESDPAKDGKSAATAKVLEKK